jgi:predicted dehydrogenase
MKGICIVGCGAIGRAHARSLAGRARLSFYSRSQESALRLAAKHDGAEVFADYSAVLASAAVDAVVLCSPPEAHTAQVVKALAARKAVLVEKPLCTNIAELTEIESALGQTASPPLFMVAENYYYKPSLHKLEALIRDGRIGAIRRVHVRKVQQMVPSGWKARHGALLEGGIHFVALVSELAGGEPVSVNARLLGSHVTRTPERGSVTTIEYENGVIAELTYAWNVPSLTRGVFQHSRVEGERGTLIFESNGLYILRGMRPHLTGLRDLSGHAGMIDDFIACLEDPSRSPYSNFKRAKRDLSVVFRAYEQVAAPSRAAG